MTDRQAKNNIPSIFRSGGIKTNKKLYMPGQWQCSLSKGEWKDTGYHQCVPDRTVVCSSRDGRQCPLQQRGIQPPLIVHKTGCCGSHTHDTWSKRQNTLTESGKEYRDTAVLKIHFLSVTLNFMDS
ncbi:hypothetical protein DPMN_096963 [Dreissena polymorpha]|uniref:Uncharacterized protein n=1 Tax=Dreissena polymorpha TaxID=45954 RepID=A0A9D4LA70_DREPO|nr:hypothetical protein DPMN_096963 [Dreissena polymorpha]